MKEFTFIFLLFNLKGRTDIQEDFNGELETQLLNSKYNDTINILIVYTNFFEPPHTTRSIFGTRLLKLIKGSGQTNWESKVVANFGNINIGDEDVLSLIFTYIKSNYAAKEFIVYSNNHSNQFGALSENIFEFMRAGTRLKGKIGFIRFNKKENEETPFADFNYSIETKPKIDMLTYNEFSKAFVKSFINNLQQERVPGAPEKVAVLILVSCYSATVDNIVNFSESVRYLCVSEGEIFYNFINLTKLIEYFTDPGILTLEAKINSLFRNIDSDYPETDVHIRELNIGRTQFNCFRLVDQQAVQLFINNINLFVNYVLSNLPVLETINEKGYQYNQDIAFITRPFDENYPTTSSIDLKLFLTNIRSEEDTDLQFVCEKLINHAAALNTASYKENSDLIGLSIFIPFLTFLNLRDETYKYASITYSAYSKQANEFSKKTLWPELLQAVNKIKVYKDLLELKGV